MPGRRCSDRRRGGSQPSSTRPGDGRGMSRMGQHRADYLVKTRRHRLRATSGAVVGVVAITVATATALWAVRSGHEEARLAVRTAASGGSDPSPTFGPAATPTQPATAPSAPTASQPSAATTGLCQARLAQYAGPVNPTHVSLVATFESNAADVAADDERQHGRSSRSPFASRNPSEHEAVCWFDADSFLANPGAAHARGRT
jgi:hypothetical protein